MLFWIPHRWRWLVNGVVMERKLAAILSADVVGYSRMMGDDENATLRSLHSHREIVDALIVSHRGRVFNSAGDSVVAEFPSAVEACFCAVKIQKELARQNQSISTRKQLRFRIGINIGDVVVKDGNLFGDGVNLADRVQKLAEPGGICISRNVHDQLTGKAEFKLEPMGEHKLKNIAAPVSIYRVLIGDAANLRSIVRRYFRMAQLRRPTTVIGVLLLVFLSGVALRQWQRSEPGQGGFPSVAILPFQNFTGDPKLGAYGDGVVEDLTTALSRFPDVTVVSRKPTGHLKVDYVIEGSVQEHDRGLRLNVQLIDAYTDAHIWAEGYEGRNPAALQGDAIGQIANALASQYGQIRKHEYKRIVGKPGADFGEYDYFLAGHEILARSSDIEEHDRGGSVWQDGLQKFPNSALLQASLANYYFLRPWNYDTGRAAADYRRAEKAAKAALSGQSVAPSAQWRGHYVMAYTHWFKGEFERAVGEAEAAVALAPYDADTLSFMSRVQIASGNTDRALEWVRVSERLNPGVQRNTRVLAWIYYLTGEYEKSIAAAKQHQMLSREFGGDASSYMVASYARLGQMDDARSAIRRGMEAEPRWSQLTERRDQLQKPYKNPAIFQRFLADLAAGGLPELPLGYDGKKNRLRADDIKALTFGHTMRGKDVRTGQSFRDVIKTDGAVSTSGDFGTDTATVGYLGDSMICYKWNEWGANCAALFRSEREEITNAFTMVDACCEYQYSLER